jgi:tetratricopeptide (TPR) repeat protein
MDKAKTVIDGLDARWGKDAKKGPVIQGLRGKMFLNQGKFDEAAKWVDDLFKKDPVIAAGPAGQLARELDKQGSEKYKTNPESLEVESLWKRAARYYWISIEPQVSGKVSQSPDEMTAVGNRFYAYGAIFNGLPNDRLTFVDWTPGAKSDPLFWERAVQIYRAALDQSPDYRMTINLARTLGFLKKWADSASVYQKLFEQESIVDARSKGTRLDTTVLNAKGELLYAYLEWGVAEQMAAREDKDDKRPGRAIDIFQKLMGTIKADSKNPFPYWAAKYHQVTTLVDLGRYGDADLAIKDVERQVNPKFDEGKFGYQALFEAVKVDLAGKLVK